MKTLSFFLLLIGAFVIYGSLGVQGDPTSNYLELAYDSALAMRERYYQVVDYYHNQLTEIINEMGRYYLDHMEDSLEQATTQQQGEALRLCARQASIHAQDSILGVHNAIFATETAATQLHLSIYKQLMETNIKESTLDTIYYHHSYRMEEAYQVLTEELHYQVTAKANYLYYDFYAITEELDDCVAAAVNL